MKYVAALVVSVYTLLGLPAQAQQIPSENRTVGSKSRLAIDFQELPGDRLTVNEKTAISRKKLNVPEALQRHQDDRHFKNRVMRRRPELRNLPAESPPELRNLPAEDIGSDKQLSPENR